MGFLLENESEMKKKVILKLSQSVHLFSKKINTEKDVTKEIPYNHYLRYNNKLITLSPLMYKILECFKIENNLDNVIKEITEKYRLDDHHEVNTLANNIYLFVKKMHHNKVLINENKKDITFKFDTSGLKKGSSINSLVIEDIIHKTDSVFVFKGHKNTDITKKYLVKILTDFSKEEQFFREYFILSSLKPHINIRSVYSKKNTLEEKYIVLEYIEGKTFYKSNKIFSIKEKISLCYQFLNAINHLHQSNILHGDIHMYNFLVNNDNKLTLIDMGMSFDSNEKQYRIHGGVPHFMSPERVSLNGVRFSEKQGDILSEVFQTGLVLYQIIYEKKPFTGVLWRDLAKSITEDTPSLPLLTKIGEQVPEEILHLISKSIEKEPKSRFNSIAEMLELLKK